MFNRLPALARFLLALIAIGPRRIRGPARSVLGCVSRGTRVRVRGGPAQGALSRVKFDLRLALLLLLPLALLAGSRFRSGRRRAARIAWLAYLAAAHCVVLLLYFVDSDLRLRAGAANASLVDHLTPIGWRRGWRGKRIRSCPASWPGASRLRSRLVAAHGAATLAPAADPMNKWTRRATVAPSQRSTSWGSGASVLYPLRWSEAYFSASEAVAALALNPVLFLADTAENRTLPYDADKCASTTRIRHPCSGQGAGPGQLDFARYVTPLRSPRSNTTW